MVFFFELRCKLNCLHFYCCHAKVIIILYKVFSKVSCWQFCVG